MAGMVVVPDLQRDPRLRDSTLARAGIRFYAGAAMVMARVELEHDYGRRDPLSGLPNRNQFATDLADLARAHPTLGSISPAEFVLLVEQTALARPMTGWVLEQALAQQQAWRAQGISIVVSINVSARTGGGRFPAAPVVAS